METQTALKMVEGQETIFDQLQRMHSSARHKAAELRFCPGLPNFDLGRLEWIYFLFLNINDSNFKKILYIHILETHRSLDIQKMLESAGYKISRQTDIVQPQSNQMRRRVKNEFASQYSFLGGFRDSTSYSTPLKVSFIYLLQFCNINRNIFVIKIKHLSFNRLH